MTKRFFLLAALAGVWSVSAQNGTLHLRLVDRVTREPVVGAVAELRSQADTARTPFYAASDIDGAALLQRVPAGAWRLRCKFFVKNNCYVPSCNPINTIV